VGATDPGVPGKDGQRLASAMQRYAGILRWLGAAASLAILAGCAGVRTRSAQVEPAPAWSAAALAARAVALETTSDWRLQARVAISAGRQGGSGQLDWQQQGAGYRIAFDAPLNAQGWRLQGDATRACLDGLPGGTQCAADADGLLAGVLGQPVPLDALGAWLRGMPADAARFGVATPWSSDDGTVGLEQAGWRIGYTRWSAPAGGSVAMPIAMVAQRGDLRLRLVVDTWRTAAP
jgi:outer membrane lipoprotein LolB